jgi:predicted Zn finger-like uncharacterized protein
MNLQIQCPNCTKRFTVHEDLTGKTVECGSCDHRFPVKSESIIVERAKVYPGEHRRDEFLNRLGKSSSDDEVVRKKTPAPLTPQVDSIMEASAGQKIAAAVGVVLILLYGLLFFLGTDLEGMFQDVSMEKRLLLGGFVGLIGAGLIIFGAKNWRLRAVLFSLVLVGGLMAMIFERPVHATPTVDQPKNVEIITSTVEIVGTVEEDDIKTKVGFLGMQRKIDAMSALYGPSGSEYVIGIFVENLSGSEFHEIGKFLKQVLNIPPTEGINRYQRNGERDSLIVISGIKLDFDTVVRYCERLGRPTTYPEYRLIDLKLSSAIFSEPDEDQIFKMSNPDHPAFFTQNLEELRALDISRVKKAVNRLSTLPVGIELRNEEEIIGELLRILASEEDPLLLSDLGKALRIWAGNNRPSVDVATRRVETWIENEVLIPSSIIEYLIENEAEKAPLFVDLLWAKDAEAWHTQYASLGSFVEPRLLFHLESSPPQIKKAALILLAKVGTAKSLPTLQKLVEGSDSELKILAERAIEGINAR